MERPQLSGNVHGHDIVFREGDGVVGKIGETKCTPQPLDELGVQAGQRGYLAAGVAEPRTKKQLLDLRRFPRLRGIHRAHLPGGARGALGTQTTASAFVGHARGAPALFLNELVQGVLHVLHLRDLCQHELTVRTSGLNHEPSTAEHPVNGAVRERNVVDPVDKDGLLALDQRAVVGHGLMLT